MRAFAANMLLSLCDILDHIPVRRDGRWATAQSHLDREGWRP